MNEQQPENQNTEYFRGVTSIKLQIFRPLITFLENQSPLQHKQCKNLAFGVSFVSINGVDENKIDSGLEKEFLEARRDFYIKILENIAQKSLVHAQSFQRIVETNILMEEL